MKGKFRGYGHPLNSFVNDADELMSPVISTDKPDQPFRRADESMVPREIDLPSHLFIPRDAQSVDIRRAADVGPTGATTPTLLMSFKAPKGARVHFISYGVFSDGADASLQQFIPKVDKNRAFPYQGDPNDGFKINLGLAPDLSNSSLIACQLTLNPEETITWEVINTNAVAIAMAVRMVGYLDYTMKRDNARSGG